MSTIEKVKSFPDCTTLYRTSCECLDESHSFNFSVECDEYQVTLVSNMELQHDSRSWGHPQWNRWIRSYINRIKSCWKLLTTGCLTYEGTFIFRGDENIDDFCEVVQKAKDEMKKKCAQEDKERG